MYQRLTLSDHSLVGAPGSIPSNLVGLSDAVLADLSAAINPPPAGMAGQGFWPVIVTAPANFDPTSQVIVPPSSYTADPASKTVIGQQTARAMTTDEFAAANPVPEMVTNYQARAALVQANLFTQVDQGVRASGNQLAIQAWDYANNFYRSSPFIAALKSVAGQTDAQVDDLFRAATKIS